MTTPATEVGGQAQAQYADARVREQRQPAGGSNFFTRKYGPLPGWGWSLIIAGAGVGYYLWRKRSQTPATGTATSGTGTAYGWAGTGTGVAAYGAELAAIQREIGALQNGTASTTTSTTSTETFKMPNLKGMTLDRAHQVLDAAGLTYNKNPGASKRGFDRIITAHNPPAGATVHKGQRVGITWHYVKEKTGTKGKK